MCSENVLETKVYEGIISENATFPFYIVLYPKVGVTCQCPPRSFVHSVLCTLAGLTDPSTPLALLEGFRMPEVPGDRCAAFSKRPVGMDVGILHPHPQSPPVGSFWEAGVLFLHEFPSGIKLNRQGLDKINNQITAHPTPTPTPGSPSHSTPVSFSELPSK